MHFHPRASAPIKARLSLVLPLLLGSLSQTAHAQITNTWTGAGTTNNWSLATNWKSSLVPVSAATTGLDFTGTASTSNNDLGTFQLNIMKFDVTKALTLSGNELNFVSNGTLPILTQNSTSSITIDNNIGLSSNLAVGLVEGGQVNLAGVVSGAGSLTVTGNQSTYTTILSNANNSYTGGTVVTGGTLELGANNALTSGTDLTVTGTTTGASVNLDGYSATVGNINFADGTSNSTHAISITDTAATKGLLTLNGNITYNPAPYDSNFNGITPTAYLNANVSLASGQHVLDNNGNGSYSNSAYDVIFNGTVSGSGGIDLGVDGESSTGLFVALGKANTYTGATNLYNGSLYLGAANALPLNTTVTIGADANLYLYIASDDTETGLTKGSYSQSIGSLADNGEFGGGYIYLGNATLTVGSNNASTVFTGSISDNDGLSSDTSIVGGSLVKVGTGTLTLGGTSYYTGSTTIKGGTLQLGTDDALPDTNNGVADNTDLMLTGGTFDMNGYSQMVNKLTNGGGNVLVSGGSVLTANAVYSQSAGTTQVDGTLNLTPGQDLTLSGGNLVGTGTLGNATSSGTITVTNSGGTVRPGDLLPTVTVGTLTINGNYTQTSGGTLEIDLASKTSNDVLAVTNNANLAGTLNIKLLNGFVPTVGETFQFMDYGTVSNNFTSIVGLDPGFTYTDSFANGVGTLTVLTIAAVPETSTLCSTALMLGAGGLLLCRQRRLSRSKTALTA